VHFSSDVVYRNLKVEELLFGSDGYVLLSDFGLAKIVPGLTYTLCGTPQVCALDPSRAYFRHVL
jgi:serine/threonine protein kinase